MRGDYRLPDYPARDSLAEVTEIYVRPDQASGSGAYPLQPVPVQVQPQPLPGVRMFSVDDSFAIPCLGIGSAPNVRISSTTERVPRFQLPRNPLVWIGVVGCIVLGISLGLLTARGGGNIDEVAAKPVHVTAPSPQAAQITVTPIIAPAVKPIAKPALVTVHIESLPGGATATLLDNGKTTKLGMTPLDAELDPTKAYDIVVQLDGKPPRVQHVVPAQQQDIVFAFDDAAPKQDEPVAAAPAPVVAPKVVAPKHAAPKHAADDDDDDAAPAQKHGTGTLKLASKPPCSIAIDGKATGKMTPQAALSLSAGTHEITFTNADQGIQLTTSVEITADKVTNLAKDFTN